VKAGNDLILHPPDDVAAFDAIRDAVKSGDIPMAQIDASVTRILRAKAMTGLNRTRAVNLDSVANILGGRAHQAVADEVSQRSITLIRDQRRDVPLKVAPDAHVRYLSVLDFTSGWRIASPSRTFIPELKKHWPNVTSV
jgi:beta-glucosidase-like glycosyl hydrolase